MVNSHTKPPVSQVKIKQIQCIVTGNKEAQFTVTGKLVIETLDIYILTSYMNLSSNLTLVYCHRFKKKFSLLLLVKNVKNKLSIKAHVK